MMVCTKHEMMKLHASENYMNCIDGLQRDAVKSKDMREGLVAITTVSCREMLKAWVASSQQRAATKTEFSTRHNSTTVWFFKKSSKNDMD